MKKRVRIAISSALVVFLAGGCCSERHSAVPLVDDVGAEVATKYRYNLSCIYFHDTMDKDMIKCDSSFLPRCQPRVFSSSGIPFVLRMELGRFSSEGGWSILLPMLSLGILPEFSRYADTFKCRVELADESEVSSSFECMSVCEYARSLLPTAFLFYNDDAKVEGRRVFCDGTRHSGDNSGPSFMGPLSLEAAFDSEGTLKLRMSAIARRAFAYAIAAKLKELEDSGKIEAMLRKKLESMSVAPPHSVVRLERDSDNAFAYSFEIEMLSAPSDAKSAAREVLYEFMGSVKEDYLNAHPNADAASLAVSFSNLKLKGLRIEGRAAVLTIKPLSLSYDTNTRRGKMSVRFNPGQAEEARKWVRKNIETLARDKNIALVTGEIPPAAKFYMGREELKDGNILEIEFKTE